MQNVLKTDFKEWFGSCRTIAHTQKLGIIGQIGDVTYSVGYELPEYNGLRRKYGLHETRSTYFARMNELRKPDGTYAAPGYRRATLRAARDARICNPISNIPA